MPNRRRFITRIAVAASSSGLTWFGGGGGLAPLAAVSAQSNYPNKPIRLIVPFAPGGSSDLIGRLIAQHLGSALGQPIVVENRAGAGGTIGAEAIARAPADGYTIGVGSVSTCGTAPAVYKGVKYDPRKDFAPIINIAAVPGIITVHPSFPAKNYAEFIALLRANPDKFNYASSGAGGVGHMAMELFKLQTGTKMTHIGYRGAGPALTDVLAGNVPIMWDNLTSTLPHVKGGKLIPIGLAHDKRVPQLPDLPTFFELGLKQYDASTWFGLVAPANTPKEIIARLHGATAKLLTQPEVTKKLLDAGAFAIGNTPEQFAAQIGKEVQKWAEVAKFAKVEPAD
jgi:tripartite-type tricarboxylate transporter receptor subunit TctC